VKPRLSVFTGREAKLNKAIFQVLAIEGALTIYEINKKVRTERTLRHAKYSVINRRAKNLVEKGYIEKVGARKTQAGFESQLYQITFRTYLAIIVNRIDFDHLIETAGEEVIISALSSLILTET
jgi:hypothetical protein